MFETKVRVYDYQERPWKRKDGTETVFKTSLLKFPNGVVADVDTAVDLSSFVDKEVVVVFTPTIWQKKVTGLKVTSLASR